MAVLGKGKKGKEPELSEADKAAEDKKRRLRENDYRKRLTQEIRGRLIKEMEMELQNTAHNKVKVQNQWRKIMRMAKVEALRKDIEILSQSHERDVDRKDAIILMLDKDLEDAEEQYQTALRSHLQNIDELIDVQDSRLLALENEFNAELATISSEFNVEREQIEQQHHQEKTELLNIMEAVEAEEQERESEARQEHEQTREEIRNKNLEDINVLRITLESAIEELERHFESAHLNYLQSTDQRTQDFKFLTRKDQELSKDIEVKIRKIEKLQNSIAHWRTKISSNGKECEDRNNALREEKDQISKHFSQLKSRMNSFRDQQSKRLTDLTKSTFASRKVLTDKLEQAERVLKLAELARKYETEQEKVLPFYETTVVEKRLPNDSEEKEGDLMKKARAIGPDGALVNEFDALESFFKRYNKVMLSKIAVEKEKERLHEENQALQKLLKQYLDGVTVTPELMNSLNPLLVVNGKVNITNRADARQAKPNTVTVVEGNHMVSTRRIG